MYLNEEVFVSSECNNMYRHPNSIVKQLKPLDFIISKKTLLIVLNPFE
jgi:hypothetical protein